ncbi:hypothetical protein pipiens_015015 [Culex pipiens pipiens]|uniref:DUF4794 domain-containing protein n=1 Tax=Culex pipiens pipiens TaxID=38569 RepID=A0ABD1CSF7_CULPP
MRAFVFCMLVAAAAAEAPFAGYAPSGWRPQGAQFRLPNEYGAPLVQQPRVQVEGSRQRGAHAAQIAQLVETTTELANEYLPPTATDLPEQLDPIRVQGLPDSQVKDFQRANPQVPARRVNQPAAPTQQPLFPLSGQRRARPGFPQFGRQVQQPLQPQQPQQLPAQTYGTPDQDSEEQPEEAQPTTTVQPESDDDDDQDQEDQDEQTDDAGRTVVAVANAFSGQYYILGADNTRQRVTYATSQDDEDLRNMGFTAQLRYAPVEPITGPVYAYNEQGQLVRIYK